MTGARRDRWVYVIGNAASHLVKIGSTRDIALRLANLQVGSPAPLHLLLSVRTNAFAEHALHQHFVPYRRHGEWFDFGDLDPAVEVCAAIAAIGTTPESARKRKERGVRPARRSTSRYVAALREAGVPAGYGRDRIKEWAGAHGVALPGKTEVLAEIVAELKRS